MEVSNVPSGAAEGNILDKYRLIAELGHGGMAEVFLAVASGPAGFNKLVVIKQIRAELAEDPEFLNMFLDEARLAARLSHPNVVQTNEVGHVDNRYFIAMEYLDGQPLNRILQRLRRDADAMPLAMQIRILIDVLAGLNHAHELNDYDGTPLEVVHRDVSPHNVFITYEGQIKVVDFGIAKAMNSSSETRAGIIKGKVAYMSPEQARGDRVDRRADVFAVGVMLWESITGQRLWKGLTDVAMLHKIIKGDIPKPSTIKPEVSERMEAICMKALSPNREDRYDTAADFQSALEELLSELGERVSPRDIGKLIAKTFDQDRTHIKSVIETQLRKSAGSTQTLPTIATLGGSAIARGSTASRAMLPSLKESGTMSGQFPTGPTSVGASPSTPSSLILSASSNPPEAKKKPFVLIGAIVGAAAIGGIIWLVTWKPTPTETPNPAASAAPTAVVAPTSTTPPTADEVEIKVNASPGDARIFIDSKPMIGNPFAGKFAKDAVEHQVRVEAQGFKTGVRTISFANNLTIDIALEKDSKTPVGGPGPVVAPPPTEEPKPGNKRPVRPVDGTNPYAN